MMSVLREEECHVLSKGVTRMILVITNAPQLAQSRSEAAIECEEEIFRERIGRITKGEALWSRIEDLDKIEKEGVMIVGAAVNDEAALLRLEMPKEMRKGQRLWDALTEGQKLDQIEEEYPYIRAEEIVVNQDEWDNIRESVKNYGIFVKIWEWKNWSY